MNMNIKINLTMVYPRKPLHFKSLYFQSWLTYFGKLMEQKFDYFVGLVGSLIKYEERVQVSRVLTSYTFSTPSPLQVQSFRKTSLVDR